MISLINFGHVGPLALDTVPDGNAPIEPTALPEQAACTAQTSTVEINLQNTTFSAKWSDGLHTHSVPDRGKVVLAGARRIDKIPRLHQ